jgi:hypothetical protein
MPGEEKVYATFPLRRCLLSLFRYGVIVFLLFNNLNAGAQDEFDEISVFMEIPKVGGFDIPAVIRGEELFLPITDLFSFLKIKNVPSDDFETVSGYFISTDATYLISRQQNLIRYQDNTIKLQDGDLIKTETNLYLRSSYFGKIFGLDCNFSFRNLSILLNTRLDLPLIREMRQQEMRKNIGRLKGEIEADTIIQRTYPFFRLGMADWSVISNQEVNGKSDARVNLNLGGMVAGGELRTSFNYSSLYPFEEKQQFYLWRYVDNDFSLVKQVSAGKISAQSTSTLFNPVLGIQLTNTPTTYRRSFGTYTLTDRTEPGWIVELYINNVLVDYVKADASGFFQFQVPLVYGNSTIQLKFFGPWGEESVREQNINIPYNFIPEGKFEYKVSAGVVEDSSLNRFSRVSMNYGLSRRITVGAGFEYFSRISGTPFMPYVNGSWSVLNNLLISGEYTHNVRSTGTVSYRSTRNIQVDLNYIKYAKDQRAIFYNYLEERKASVAIPLRINKFSAYNRFSLYQIILPGAKVINEDVRRSSIDYTTGEWMFSGNWQGINGSVTTYAIFSENITPRIYSNFSASFKLPAEIITRPQFQYHFQTGKFISARMEMEKYIKGSTFMNLSYERQFINNLNMVEFGIRHNFDFTQAGATARSSGRKTSFIEYARGSLIYDGKTKYLGADNQYNVGKGGISVTAYLDLNANGVRDNGEPKAYGLNLRAGNGHIEKNDRDTTIRILGLEPYTNCYIDLDGNSFDNMFWRLPGKIMSVAVDPEIMKHIDIPVTVVGEVSGSVLLKRETDTVGLGRIVIRFSDKYGKTAGSILSEEDGYFTFFGLAPGEYVVSPDSAQLKKLSMTSYPESLHFTVNPGKDGAVVEKLDFLIRKQETDTSKEIKIILKPIVVKDTTAMVIHEVVEELVTISHDSYAIQLGAFGKKSNAENLRRKLQKLLPGRKTEIILENDLNKLRVTEIDTREEVDKIIEILRQNGITEVWIISLRAKQQMVVLVEKSDSVINIFESKVFMPFSESFYKLEAGNKSLSDKPALKFMKEHSPVGDLKVKQIQPMVRYISDEKAEEPVPPVRKNITIEKIKPLVIRLAAKLPLNMVLTKLSLSKIKVPEISIQVGLFYKKSEALKAQRKISSKLKLPVVISEQWEYYIVLIPGFHSREETFIYYPELAGIGYPGVTIVEK